MRPAVTIMAVIYGVLSTVSLLTAPADERRVMLPLLALSCAGLVVLRVALARRELTMPQVWRLGRALAVLPTATTAVDLLLTGAPILVMWMMMTIVGTGALLRSTPWFAATTVVSVLAYVAVAIPRFSVVWLEFGIGLAASILLGSALHFVVGRTTARLEGAHRALAAQAGTDALTGLPNRHALPGLFARASANSPVALLFVDVDKLKEVNDTDGHAAGDALIVGVGRALAGVFRGTDTVVRVGGDEFVVVLPGVMSQEAEAFAQRAELACSLTAPHGVSVGVASSDAGDGVSLDALLSAADHAMYVVKARRGSGTGSRPERRGTPPRRSP